MNENRTILDKAIYFFLSNKLVVFLVIIGIVLWGIVVAPFDWNRSPLPAYPVPVDAIPDIGENQQIVFTEWKGRSPQDIEDQITYPLTVSMLGLPGVKTVRSYSMFGFSTIYIIFKEKIDFYWARSRVLEKLNSLSTGMLPEGVQPVLGPDSTALGQVFWYSLEGRDEKGGPVGGWDLNELRSIQDWYVRYALLATDGISEVASVGGFVKEYQIDVDPDAMRAYGISLQDIFQAVKMSNVDVGARTIEVNKTEYVIRGLGFIKSTKDLEETVVSVKENVPIFVKNIGNVVLGPALRRGALDKEGTEAVGGVVVVRYGDNPLQAIKNLKKKIKEISPGLPIKPVVDYTKVSEGEVAKFAERNGFPGYLDGRLNEKDWLAFLQRQKFSEKPEWIELSKVTIVPFYDRTKLINETLETLNIALYLEILVTIIVIIIMLLHLRSSVVISATLPLTVLLCFITMKLFRVDANIVALSGIAIAIGTIVDMGTVVCENILKHLKKAPPSQKSIEVIFGAVSEVGSAVLTAILTTVVSFLPVFTMIGAEGKLFRPLAFTKTFTLMASVLVALFILPAIAHILFSPRLSGRILKPFKSISEKFQQSKFKSWIKIPANMAVVFLVTLLLTEVWLPLGPGVSFIKNFITVIAPIGILLGSFLLFQYFYPVILKMCLRFKLLFLSLPILILLWGGMSWVGFNALFNWLPDSFRQTRPYSAMVHAFPGLGKEFMPNLDEGSFLYMPTTMPHASIGEVMDVLRKQDMAFAQIPEIESAVGKLGRAETPLDPAPISMIETIINYRDEYLSDEKGQPLLYKFDPKQNDLFRNIEGKPLNAADGKTYLVAGKFIRDNAGKLIPDDEGRPFRLWRAALDPALNEGRNAWAGIRSNQDIWDEIVKAGEIPGTTSAPKLQPIAARIVMLQSGMRAPMGIKIKGPDLKTIENAGMEMEKFLREVPGVEKSSVFADRIVGKPYLEIAIDREKIARYGLHIREVQDVIEVAVGGKTVTTTVEGRERYPVRVRYYRELRDNIESLSKIIVPAPNGQQVPLIELADIKYTKGPQMIKSEDTFLIGYLLFDKQDGFAETDVVENAKAYFAAKIADGALTLPAGVSYSFAGNYENQVRAQKTLSLVLPLALFIIFIILYFQFRSIPTTLLVFSGIIVAWAGGFILLWLYGCDWFMNFSLFDISFRELFQIHTINLSVAVWVGFLALFGIASDDGVIMATYISDRIKENEPKDIVGVRQSVLEAGNHRIRPCLITTATTILALLPVLTATGRGADIMIPMAIPVFGGMIFEIITMLIVPVLFCSVCEWRLKQKR